MIKKRTIPSPELQLSLKCKAQGTETSIFNHFAKKISATGLQRRSHTDRKMFY